MGGFGLLLFLSVYGMVNRCSYCLTVLLSYCLAATCRFGFRYWSARYCDIAPAVAILRYFTRFTGCQAPPVLGYRCGHPDYS